MDNPRTSYRVCDVPQHLRPREKLQQQGVGALDDEELLAIVLRGGTQGKSVLEIARDLIHQFGSLSALAGAPVDELKKVPGLGTVKVQVIQAAIELGRRSGRSLPDRQPHIEDPEAAVRQVRDLARNLDREIFWLLLLDTRHRLMREPVRISEGILDASLVHPREVFKTAIQHSCAAVVLAHNHPSGDPSPSPDDLRVTRKLVESGKILEIQVLDHVIVGQPRNGAADFVSLRESGLVVFDA